MGALGHHFFNLDALWLSRLILIQGAIGSLKLGAATLYSRPWLKSWFFCSN